MFKKWLYHIIVFVLLPGALLAQDPHMSQYNASPIMLNPALTGFFNGDFRAVAQYRSQWGSFTDPYRTIAASFDIAAFRGKLNGDHVGFGLQFFNDRAGVNALTTNSVGFSMAYRKTLGHNVKHALAVGAYIGYYSQKIDVGDLTFDNQYNGVQADPNIPSGEDIGNSTGTVDAAIGGIWQIMPNRFFNFYVGGSYFHIVPLELSFVEGSGYTIQSKYIGHMGAKLDVSDAVNILPSAVYFQQGRSAREILVGSYLQFMLDDYYEFPTAFSLGTWFRVADPTPDALILGARLDFRGVILGFSYDLNVSGLKTASQSRGAYEVSLTYIGDYITRGQRNLMIPCPQL